MTLQQLMDSAALLTQQVALEQGGIAMTMFFVDGDSMVGIYTLPDLPKSAYARRCAVHVLRSILRRNKATAYVMASEAWTRTVTKAEEQAGGVEWEQIAAQMRRDGIADDPLRQECAVYVGGDKDKGISRSWLYLREGGREDGKLVGFKPHGEPYEFDRNSDADSWMIGLLW